jgi:hypothetical protein
MNAFELANKVMIADPNMGREIQYTHLAGGSQTIRVVLSTPYPGEDKSADVSIRLMMQDIDVSPDPVKGDSVTIGSKQYKVWSNPRNISGMWTLDLKAVR